MNYLTDLTEDEIKYVCSVIPFKEVSDYFRRYPKEFMKLRPGFRVNSLNENAVTRMLYVFHNKDFVASFLIKHIDRWIQEINEELKKASERGLDKEAAYIEVLSQSYFSGNIALFFKIIGEVQSEEYLKVMSSAVSYQVTCQKANEEEQKSLKKEQQELECIQRELEEGIVEKEKKAEKLKKNEIELKEKLKEKTVQFEKEQEKVNNLVDKLKKAQDDEIWKTAEMQQKIDTLTFRLNEQEKKTTEYKTSISEYVSRLSSAEDDIKTWKNQVRNREKQLFTYKAERATLLTEKEADNKKIRELKEALNDVLSVEKIYKERLSTLNTEKESYQQKNRELEEIIEEQKKIESVAESTSKRYYPDTYRKMPLCPEDMDDFDDYFTYNLENIGFDGNDEGSLEFIDYLEKSLFCGIPVLIKRGPGINLANCLANTLYGVPVAGHFMYSESAGIEKISEYLVDTPDRVVCIDGFIGNCNEMELIPVLEQHRNKIIIITYMYDRTLSFVPTEVLSSVHFISADVFSSILRIKDITEEPSGVKEVSYAYKSSVENDSRSQKIFYEIACECGFGNDTACSMADMIKDENHLNEMLMFTLLPYVSKVLRRNPYNCSKRLQRYAGEAGRCSKKDILMRWFG